MCDKTNEEEYNWTIRNKILIVGKGGNGKKSCKKSIENAPTKTNEILAVVASGVGDTEEQGEDDFTTVKNNLKCILRKCQDHNGFNAIVFVLKYGVRFTNQEKKAAEEVKLMFGSEVFRKFGIILMTYGDLFEMENEVDNRSFKQWCRDQHGDIQKLFEEVNYRIVLFDNKIKDTSKLDQQLKKLNDYVSGLNVRYGLEEFGESITAELHQSSSDYTCYGLLLVNYFGICGIILMIMKILNRYFSCRFSIFK